MVVAASTAKMATILDVEKINVNVAMIQECAKFVRRDGTTFSVIPPEEAAQEKEIRLVVYHTQVVVNRKLEYVTVVDIKVCLRLILGKATYIKHGRKYGVKTCHM